MSKIQDNPKTSVSAPTTPSPAPSRTPRESDEPAREAPPARRAGTDTALVAARPETIADQQRRLVDAVRARQLRDRAAVERGESPAGGPPSFTPPRPTPEGDLPDLTQSTPKKVLDGVLAGDGARQGIRIATNLDELGQLPVLGRALAAADRAADVGGALTIGGRLFEQVGKLVRTMPNSGVGQMVQRVVSSPAGKLLGRAAPFLGAGVAFLDGYDAVRTVRNPKATSTEKILATTKAVLSGISGTAGVVAVMLAPTGAGAAVAGGIALGAGLAAVGVDFFLSRERTSNKG
ncbi:MAG: hypothetical protein VKP72_09880 [bacterium]|nr:hypothetical protein [bacterium]